MNDKKMKFHITITNNETGETLHDEDACAIIAGVNEGDRTGSIIMTDCGPEDLVETLNGAENGVMTVYEGHPELRALALYLKVMNKKQSEETENNQ